MSEDYSQYKNSVNKGCMVAFVSIGALILWFIILPLVASQYHLQSTRKMLRGPGAAVAIYILCAMYWLALRPVMNALMDRTNEYYNGRSVSTIQSNEKYKERISFAAAAFAGAIVFLLFSKLYMWIPLFDHWRWRAGIELCLAGMPVLVGIITYKLVYQRASISKRLRKESSDVGYMPFTMVGSWLGLCVGLIPMFLFLISNPILVDIISIVGPVLFMLNPIFWISKLTGNTYEGGYIALLSHPIVYFLYGWGIHSFFRAKKTPPANEWTKDMSIELYSAEIDDSEDN